MTARTFVGPFLLLTPVSLWVSSSLDRVLHLAKLFLLKLSGKSESDVCLLKRGSTNLFVDVLFYVFSTLECLYILVDKSLQTLLRS